MTSGQSQPQEQNGIKARAADKFYSRAVDRITRFILLLGVLIAPLVWQRYGLVPACGFLLGAAISYLNFQWLAGAVRGLADRIVEAQSGEKGSAIVARFLLRYLLIGFAAYVTFIGWSGAFNGLLAGLCLPVAAMMGEAACETYVALRHGL